MNSEPWGGSRDGELGIYYRMTKITFMGRDRDKKFGNAIR